MATSDKKSKSEPVKATKSAPKAEAKKPAAAAPAKGGEKDAKATAAAAQPKRKLGIKGAAPWAARHAAKHAAEARARAAEPAPPGSARATIRTPTNADEIKEKLNELLKASAQLKLLRKNLAKNFYDIGQLLREVQIRKLYEARNYPSFDAFVERETDLGKELGLKIARIAVLFTKEAAAELGLERLATAVGSIDQPKDPMSEGRMQVSPPQRPSSTMRIVEPSGRAF
jgi:hypothetical protein